MAAEPFSDAPVGAAVLPCPEEKPAHWLEIELRDEKGFPVPYEEYVVTPPGLEPVRGYLDAEGWARIEPIENPGACGVAFPNLDRRVWQRQGSAGPKHAMGVES